jgi:hypothetical protein
MNTQLCLAGNTMEIFAALRENQDRQPEHHKTTGGHINGIY